MMNDVDMDISGTFSVPSYSIPCPAPTAESASTPCREEAQQLRPEEAALGRDGSPRVNQQCSADSSAAGQGGPRLSGPAGGRAGASLNTLKS